jgi:biotin transport system ATP-binding protein
MSPGAICLDEPFSNLDLPGVRQVLSILMTLHRAGHTLIVVTHELDKILPHARRVLLMDQGRLVDDGPPETVIPRVEAHGVRQPDAYRMGGALRSWLD